MLAASRSTVTAAYKTLPTIPGWRSHAIYVDRGVLVINKPPGLASQPGPSSVSTAHLDISSPDVLKIGDYWNRAKKANRIAYDLYLNVRWDDLRVQIRVLTECC